MPNQIRVIDTHTEGEPTRILLDGEPNLQGDNLSERAADLAANHSDFRTGVLLEPRGSDVWVGAFLLAAQKPDASFGVIFFNNVGALGMCGHGTMGLIASQAYLGRIREGNYVVETPVGDVKATLHEDGSVSVQNVLSYRFKAEVTVSTSGFGDISGDVAYGGNWFFLAKSSPVPVASENIADLTACAVAIKEALSASGITGADGAEIDHIELFGPPSRSDCDSKNFVLCPGNAYDRSPCGTGTSAKLACLVADGRVSPGQVWRQESIIGTVFEATYESAEGGIVPTVTGRAYVTAESTLIFEDHDPFRAGILL